MCADAMYPRSEYPNDQDFTRQWRGSTIDTGQVIAYSMLGWPANGTINVIAEEIELPQLSAPEQTAMIELKADTGMPETIGHHIGFPEDNFFTPQELRQSSITLTETVQEKFWSLTEHPCTWGGKHAGLAPSCCLRTDESGTIQSASVTALNIDLHGLHRGDMQTSNFDGSIPNSIGSLTSLREFRVGPSYISGTIPASLGQTDLDTVAIRSTLIKGVLPDVFPRTLKRFWVSGNKYISGTVPQSIGAADSVAFMWVANSALISGTIPSMIGHSELTFLLYRDTSSISGTLPNDVHPDHRTAGLMSSDLRTLGPQEEPEPVLVRSRCLALTCYFYSRVSGTLPEQSWCLDNETSSLPLLTMQAVGGTRISGTMPDCAFSGMPRLNTMYMFKTRLSGSIPSMATSEELRIMKVDSNEFSSVPSSLPVTLQQFFSHGNPPMHAPGSELAQLLLSVPGLVDYSFVADDTVARSFEYSIQQGAIPDVQLSALIPAAPLDCRIGEPCTLGIGLVIGYGYVPSNTIGVNFEIRLNPEYVELDDHTISMRDHIFRHNNRTAYDYNADHSRTGRRLQDTDVITAEEAEASDALGAEYASLPDGDLSMSIGGDSSLETMSEAIANMSIIAPFLDNWDGSLTAKFDFTSDNEYYESTANDRVNFGGEALRPTEFVFANPGRYHFRIFCNDMVVHFFETANWHLNMHPIDCLDPLSFPDESGARCRCHAGYAPQAPCMIGDRECSCVSCKQEFSDRHHSSDGAACVQCPKGEVADELGQHCVCSAGR